MCLCLGTKIDHPRVMVVAVLAYFTSHMLDIVSTVLCMAFVTGSIESNPLMRDPMTMKFLMEPALNIKATHFLAFYLPMVVMLYAATRSWLVTSIPLWIGFVGALEVAAKNFIMLSLWGVWR